MALVITMVNYIRCGMHVHNHAVCVGVESVFGCAYIILVIYSNFSCMRYNGIHVGCARVVCKLCTSRVGIDVYVVNYSIGDLLRAAW